jgi:iron complex outermembrane receptor protein
MMRYLRLTRLLPISFLTLILLASSVAAQPATPKKKPEPVKKNQQPQTQPEEGSEEPEVKPPSSQPAAPTPEPTSKPAHPPPEIVPEKTAPEMVELPEMVPAAGEEIVIEVDKYLDAPVVTASKKVEKTAKAAAIVSVLTSDDIDEMAPETLYDILGTVPGIEIMETYYGYTSVTFRGILQTHYNDKSLMLINGTPVYDTINWSFYLEQMPMNAVKQIEVVRGPGSTLYGTNAFAGVINFIPFEGSDFKERKIRLYARYGSFNTVDVGFAGGFAKGPWAVFLAASRKDSDGYEFKVKLDEEGKSGEPLYAGDRHAYENDYLNVYSNVRYRDLLVSLNYFTNDKDKFGLTPALVGTGERTVRGFLADARYDLRIGDSVTITPQVWFNFAEKEEDLAWYPPATALKEATDLTTRVGGPEIQEFSGFKAGGDLRLDWRIIKQLQLLAGVVYEHTYMKDYLFNFADQVWQGGDLVSRPGEQDKSANAIADSQETYDVSGYLQAYISLLDKLMIVGGLRVNYNKDFGAFLAPRGGIVLTLTQQVNAKLLYGRAWRAPSFFEKHVSTNNILYGGQLSYLDAAGNSVEHSLDPEKVDTLDVGLDWTGGRHSMRLNYFYLTTGDMIERNQLIEAGAIVGGFQVTKNTPQYGNGQGYWVTGVEAEYRTTPVAGLKGFANISYRYGRSKEEDQPLHYFAPLLANVGVVYRWQGLLPWLRTALYFQGISIRQGPMLTLDPVSNSYTDQGDEMKLSAYYLLTLTVTADVLDNLQLAVIAHNLLFQDYSYPEYIRRRIEAVPGGPPASVFGRLTLKF